MKTFLFPGQSNSRGKGLITDLSVEQRRAMPNVRIFTPSGTFADFLAGTTNGNGTNVPGTFGPDLSFGQEMARHYGEPVALIKYAIDGAPLDVSAEPSAGVHFYPDATSALFPGLVATTRCALGLDLDLDLRGVLWMQGETDTTVTAAATAFYTNMTGFIASLRGALCMPHLPIVQGMIRGPAGVNLGVVQGGQYSIARDIPGVSIIDTGNFDLDSDGVHFSSLGLLQLGHAYAKVARAW